MKKSKQKQKKTSFKEMFSFNIGTIVFGAVFLYMIISVSLYLTQDHVSTYQVTAGPLAKNQTYVGFAIRNEELLYSNTGGYVTYYASNNAKVKKNGIVYGIGDSKEEEQSVTITDSVLESLRSDMSSFSSGFDTNEYNDIYRFKYEIEGKLLQNNGIVLPSGSTNEAQNITVGNQTIYTAPENGLILYSMDGYEDFSIDDVSENIFNSKNYHLENL